MNRATLVIMAAGCKISSESERRNQAVGASRTKW